LNYFPRAVIFEWMLEDRSYMRQDSFKPAWSATVLLIAANVAVYVLQLLIASNQGFFDRFLALSNHGINQGYLWQLITFQFLHANIWHLLLNMVAVFFFGRMVEERLGQATFLKVYFLSGVMGGVLHVVLGWLFPEQFAFRVLGASAGAFGLVAASTMIEPNATILVSFIFPLRAKYFLIAAAGISFFCMFLPRSSTAHDAHLGGLLAGVIYMRWNAIASRLFPSLGSGRSYHARDFMKIQSKSRRRRPAELGREEFISKEVDPILDKISAHGIQSLTPQEREILEQARAKMESMARGDS
jgi:membrane associated rhomboid family serine protease